MMLNTIACAIIEDGGQIMAGRPEAQTLGPRTLSQFGPRS